MKKIFIILGFIFLVNNLKAQYLLVDDFNDHNLVNALGGAINSWTRNPTDKTQWCKIEAVDGVLKVYYNIDSAITYIKSPTYLLDYDKDSIVGYALSVPHLSYNGVFFLLKNSTTEYLDLTNYEYLIFYARGDEKQGYPRKFQIELKTKNQQSSYIVEGLSNKWQKFVIPISQFRELDSFDKVEELTIVFNENVFSQKRGVVFFDNIYFTNNPNEILKISPPEKVESSNNKRDEQMIVKSELNSNYRWTPERKNELFNTADVIFDGESTIYNGKVKFSIEQREAGSTYYSSYTANYPYFSLNSVSPKIDLETLMLGIRGLHPMLSEMYIGNIFPSFSPYLFSANWGYKGLSVSGRTDLYDHQTFLIKRYFNSYSLGNKSLFYIGPLRLGIMGVYDSETAKIDNTDGFDVKPISNEYTYLFNLLYRFLNYKLKFECNVGKYNFSKSADADYTDPTQPVYSIPSSNELKDEMFDVKIVLDSLLLKSNKLSVKYRKVGTNYIPKYRQEPIIFEDIQADQKGTNIRMDQWYKGFNLMLYFDDIKRISDEKYYRKVQEYALKYYGKSKLILTLSRKYRREEYTYKPRNIDKNEDIIITSFEAEYDFVNSLNPGYRFPLIGKMGITQEEINHPLTQKNYINHSLKIDASYSPAPSFTITSNYTVKRFGDSSFEPKGSPFDDNIFNIFLSMNF